MEDKEFKKQLKPNPGSKSLTANKDDQLKAPTNENYNEPNIGDVYKSNRGEEGKKEDLFGGGSFDEMKEKKDPSPLTRSKME
ncbi:hypothetical protein FDP41_001786 [Naegleria fowleri]|uniref:Uncharacterized protein n=1 Tax=Naegleria fowleri TaxID=5763 RepID=A0A6A5BN63_NAEFO|nr:uncharacterized protein FDP41_001786 [Naegleria fowleri]KAF0979443.1 hypothetical protein FDP41_001786 [Naegleria fowleri]